MIRHIPALLAAGSLGGPALALDPVLTVRTPETGLVNGNYGTVHLFVDEIAGTAVPLRVVFAPGSTGATAAEVVTNLNQRDFVAADVDANGVEDGMQGYRDAGVVSPATNACWRSHPMQPTAVPEEPFVLDLGVAKTGAYRLTVRWKISGDPTWRWDGDTAGHRDLAVVVSPVTARTLRLYELNVLNIEAAGTAFATRSTLQDLTDRPGALHTAAGRANKFNLGHVKALGANCLWFQPWHPYGWESRHLSAADINARDPGSGATTWRWNLGSPSEDVNHPYALGSPYAVKNFWEIDPRLSADFTGDPAGQTDVSSAANRAKALTAWQNMVADCDAAGVAVMPDAAFNHTAHDVELGAAGIALWAAAGNPAGWLPTDRIDARERRVFSRQNDYWQRADLGFAIAPAPDRFDFSKWLDARDLFFGRYAALWRNAGSASAQTNEGDWIDRTPHAFNGTDGGSFDAITRGTWRYFAGYVPYWLGKSRPAGTNRNSTPADGDAFDRLAWDNRGIDALRCDFGQGLPPQAWEYIVNTARSVKWNFVFMAESLDGGAVTYRSNRHFDILNENLLFALKGDGSPAGLRSALESRRGAYGQSVVLLNTTSHDEQNDNDPWQALIRHAALATVDGVPMVFAGQELGLSDFYGYDLMERNVGKYVPHFKTWNSMMPLWSNTDFGLDQLVPVYAVIARARETSPALRSPNRHFLNQTNGSAHNEIFAVAKYETAEASPATRDVVLAFVNTDRNTPRSGTFNVAISSGGGNLLGIRAGRRYNVKNLAAYTAQDASRATQWLWPEGDAGRDGAQVLANGIFVSLAKVPTAPAGWTSAPYEAQYLKLYELPPSPPSGDFDGDGATNAEEFAFGTDGYDAASTPRVTAIVTEPGGAVRIELPGAPGRRFTLQSSANLVGWADEDDTAAVSVPGTGGPVFLRDASPGPGRRFYRVVATP